MKKKIKKKITKFKIAYVLGGLGLIGKEISDQLCEEGVKVIILDIKDEPKKIRYGIKYEKFDLSNLNKIENNLNKIIKRKQ